ncbi:hypothetical protein GCM10023085_45230 [Actinomadura viridis]
MLCRLPGTLPESVGAGGYVGGPPGFRGRWSASAESRPPISLDDILRRFAALADDAQPVRHVRGVGLAVAEHWLITLPAGPERDKAIDHLGEAVDLAVEALSGSR